MPEKRIKITRPKSMPKKIVKPTPSEQVIVDRRLRKKYPQMFEPDWLPGFNKKTKAGVKTLRTKRIESGLRKAGLTEADINKFE